MDKTKTTQPQQLSFSFEEPATGQVNAMQTVSVQKLVAEVETNLVIVYDFCSAKMKRKESKHASLYRQILDSVKHIG